jgi:predicted  nucleic acid-binding Zn-ribbon protein
VSAKELAGLLEEAKEREAALSAQLKEANVSADAKTQDLEAALAAAQERVTALEAALEAAAAREAALQGLQVCRWARSLNSKRTLSFAGSQIQQETVNSHRAVGYMCWTTWRLVTL